MDLFVIHEEDFGELMASIEEAVGNVAKLEMSQRHAAVQEVEGDLAEAEQILRSMGLSARSVPDSGPLQQKMQMYDEKLKGARRDLRRAQTTMQEQEDRESLFAGGMRTDLMGTSMDQREQMIAETERLQQTSEDLRDTIAVAEDTFNVGVNTMNDLDRQRSQMMHIRDNLDNINSNMGKAKYLLRHMYRRALANKAITGVIMLVLLVAIFALIYVVWIEPNTQQDPESANPDATNTSSPSAPDQRKFL